MGILTILTIVLNLGACNSFLCGDKYSKGHPRVSTAISSSNKKIPNQLTPADALALRQEAETLRAEAKAMELSLAKEKELKLRREHEKIDGWINQILVNQTVSESIQMLNTESQVAKLLIEMRFNEELVNKIFDRICETTLRPQSIENCSPLISLLLDAACKVDCMERKDNPNKRWNTRVESRLRKKLFLMGYGISLEKAEADIRVARSITGEKDLT